MRAMHARVAVALLCAGAAACRGGGSAPDASADGVVLAVRADVTGFFPNPPLANEAYTWLINGSVFEGLTRHDPDHRVEPALALRWENPDQRTYVFELKEGLRFSDGRPVTARDVAASLLAPGRHGWPTRDYLQSIESVDVVSDRRLRVRTRAPDLVLLTRLPWGFVIPAGSVDARPVPAIGTGPYFVQSWQPGLAFTMTRNPHYRGPAPAFAQARFVVVPQGDARVAQVLAGRADVADHVPFESLDALRARDDVRAIERPGLTVMLLVLRVDRPPFDDPRVREAVALSIDRDELVRVALMGHGHAATQLVPPAVPGFDPGLRPPAADLLRARQVLSALEPQELVLDGTHNRYPRDRELLGVVAAQLGRAGIRVRVNALDKRDFFALVDSGRSGLHLLGFACEAGDAGDALDQLAYSPGGRLGGVNSAALRDPALDRLIDAANRSTTQHERVENLKLALRRVAGQHAYIPLVVPNNAMLVSRRIDWEPPLDFSLRPADMRPARTATGPTLP